MVAPGPQGSLGLAVLCCVMSRKRQSQVLQGNPEWGLRWPLVLWGQRLWRDERLESSGQGRAACWGEISDLNRACKNRARAVVAGWDRMQC